MPDVRCIIHVEDPTGMAARQPVFVNGTPTPIVINEPFTVSAAAFEALTNSTLAVERLPDEEPSSPGPSGADAAAAGASGGPSGGGAAFDPEPVIRGTIAEIEDRLAGLDDEQLLAVANAEHDREVSRKGVIELVEKARHRLSTPKE